MKINYTYRPEGDITMNRNREWRCIWLLRM